MEDYQAVRNMMGWYCRAIDTREFSELSRVFDDESVFVMANGTPVKGLGAIINVLEVLTQYRGEVDLHVVSNVILEIDGDTGTSSSDWQYLAPGEGGVWRIVGVGRYQDTLRKTASGWRLAERRIVPSGAIFSGR